MWVPDKQQQQEGERSWWRSMQEPGRREPQTQGFSNQAPIQLCHHPITATTQSSQPCYRGLQWVRVRVRSSSWLPSPSGPWSAPSLGRDPATGLWQAGRSVCDPRAPAALSPGVLSDWTGSLSHLHCQSRRQREPVCQEVPRGENPGGKGQALLCPWLPSLRPGHPHVPCKPRSSLSFL